MSGTFKVSDLKGIKGNNFLVYEHFTRHHQVVDIDTAVPVTLEKLKYAYYNIIPLEDGVAVIGLINKYNAPKTVKGLSVKGKEIQIKLLEGGSMAAYIPKKPKSVFINNSRVKNYSYKDNWLELTIPENIKPESIVIKL